MVRFVNSNLRTEGSAGRVFDSFHGEKILPETADAIAQRHFIEIGDIPKR